jgi:membrane-associated PAP2 superfamily phosphatase
MELKTLIAGTRQTIAGTVYGTIVVLSVVTAGAKAFEHDPWGLAVIAAVTVVVFWVAHVYSHGLGESLNLGRRLTTSELAAIARRESSILLAAVLPVAMLVLGALGVFPVRTSLWLAVGVGVAALTVQGVRYARLERLSRAGTIVTVAVNLALGLVIVVLKAVLAH